MTDVIVTMEHMRAVRWGSRRGYCSTGVESFFERYGLDFTDFLHNGITADKLRATGNALALRAVEIAEARHGG